MSEESSKRILVFSLAYSPFESGAEIAIREVAERLSGSFTFDIITYRFRESDLREEGQGNVFIHRLGRPFDSFEKSYGHKWLKLWWAYAAFRRALLLSRKNNYRVAWCMMAGYSAATAFLFKFFNPKVKLLLSLQEGDDEAFILERVGIFKPFWNKFFRMADRIQVISAYLRDLALRHGAKSIIDIIPNGVDEVFMKSVDQAVLDGLAKKLGVKKDEKVVITTSRLVRKNAIDICIKSVARLAQSAAAVKFLIVGAGPEEEKLKELAEFEGVSDKVLFVGQVSVKEVPAYLKLAQVFIRPSRSEGLGSSFLEAMAAGLPVIGTPIGGIIDFLFDGQSGLFCKVDDVDDLCEKISIFFNNESLRQKCITEGLRLVKERYSWDKVSPSMERIFESMTAS